MQFSNFDLQIICSGFHKYIAQSAKPLQAHCQKRSVMRLASYMQSKICGLYAHRVYVACDWARQNRLKCFGLKHYRTLIAMTYMGGY